MVKNGFPSCLELRWRPEGGAEALRSQSLEARVAADERQGTGLGVTSRGYRQWVRSHEV